MLTVEIIVIIIEIYKFLKFSLFFIKSSTWDISSSGILFFS